MLLFSELIPPWYFKVYPNFSLMKSFDFFWFVNCSTDLNPEFICCLQTADLTTFSLIIDHICEFEKVLHCLNLVLKSVQLQQQRKWLTHRKKMKEKWRKLTYRMKVCSDILSLWLDSLYYLDSPPALHPFLLFSLRNNSCTPYGKVEKYVPVTCMIWMIKGLTLWSVLQIVFYKTRRM